MNSNRDAFPEVRRMLRVPEVVFRVGYRKTQIYKMMREGRFPKNFPIGARAVAWDSKDIEEWIEKQKNNSFRK